MHEDWSFPASFPQRNPITTQLRTMTTPFSPPHDPGPEVNLLPQVQNRLLLLAGQIDQLQTRLDQLTESAQENSAQLDALLAAFLTPASGQGVDVRLVELTVQVEATREQVEQMQEALATVATQEQLSSLERALAGRELLTDVADSVKKLGRTQFKANTLGETREQQIEAALAVARELVTRREQIQERRTAEERLRLDELRSTARGEFAADLLPALDSIERALDAGRTLLTSQRQQVAAARARYAASRTGLGSSAEHQRTGACQPNATASRLLGACAPQPDRSNRTTASTALTAALTACRRRGAASPASRARPGDRAGRRNQRLARWPGAGARPLCCAPGPGTDSAAARVGTTLRPAPSPCHRDRDAQRRAP